MATDLVIAALAGDAISDTDGDDDSHRDCDEMPGCVAAVSHKVAAVSHVMHAECGAAVSHNAGFKGYVPMSYRKAKFSKSWIRRWRREFGVSEPKQIHARKVPWAKLADRMRRLWRNALALRSVWHRCFAPCMATYVWIDQKPSHFIPKGKAKKLLPVAHGATHDENPVTLRL